MFLPSVCSTKSYRAFVLPLLVEGHFSIHLLVFGHVPSGELEGSPPHPGGEGSILLAVR